jgi:hypothetical protein
VISWKTTSIRRFFIIILSDETLQAVEQNNYIEFYLIEENRLNELNELSEESLEYNGRKHR